MLPLFVAAAFALLLIVGYLHDRAWLRRRPRLQPPTTSPAEGPLLSVLIPARNEEQNIGRCLTAALGLAYPRLEILVLDDNSTDGTAAILASFAGDPRLRLLQGGPLPAGWVGKCNACQQLGTAARGEWLLFLDADTAAEPGLATALLAHTMERGLDLVSLFPFQELKTFWERAVLPPFLHLVCVIFPTERMERADIRPEQVMAFGQCILVRRSAYLAIGGHGAVRNEVLEDVRLAQTLRAAGYRVGASDGAAVLRVRMYRNGAEVASGLGKHAAAGRKSGGARSWWALARELTLAFGPFWLLLGGGTMLAGGAATGWAPIALGTAVLALALQLWAARYRSYGLSPFYALLWPVGLLGYLTIAQLGMLRVWLGRGVEWKGRRYAG